MILIRRSTIAWLASLLCSLAAPPVSAQRASGDTAGFDAIFDATTLSDWDGDTAFWRVEHGAIVGETTSEKPLKANTFIIWRGGRTRDFELTLEYRMSTRNPAGNSGVQFRSAQADIDAADAYTGQIYEERGRGFLARRGQAVRVTDGGQVTPLEPVGDPDVLKSFVKRGDWNQVRIVAQGATITQFVNGHLTSMLVDEDPRGRALDGLLR